MKKIITILLAIAITSSLAGCSILDKFKAEDGSVNLDNVIDNIIKEDTDMVENSKLTGEELEEAMIISKDNAMFTKDTLPDDMLDVDIDSDGLTNAEEIQYGTDLYTMDTDGDGIEDGIEVYETETSPLKWSSRDDGVSDLEYHIVNQNKDFRTGWTQANEFNVKVRITKPEDWLYYFTKVSTDVFNELETISEAFRINEFSGVLAVDTSMFNEDVLNSITVYKDVNGVATKIDTAVNENKLVEFIVSSGDTLVLVYKQAES